MENLYSLTYVHWFVLGVLFLVGEIFLPGAFLVWFGIGGALLGLILLSGIDISLTSQVLIFTFISISSLFASQLYLRKNKNPASFLPRRIRSYIGKEFELTTNMVSGSGKIHIGDTEWLATGPEMPAGTRVKVVGFEGNCLKVVPSNSAFKL